MPTLKEIEKHRLPHTQDVEEYIEETYVFDQTNTRGDINA